MMAALPSKNASYGTKEYWDSRYKSETGQTFDWFKEYSALKSQFNEFIPCDSKILHLGTGNSTLPEDMADGGYQDQTAVDYSSIVIESMNRRPARRGLAYLEADVFQLDLRFASSSFDVAVDKGTLDAFLTHERDHDPWNPSSETKVTVAKYLQQISYVLKSNGLFIHVTFAQPHFRKPLLALLPDTLTLVSTRTIQGDGFDYFLYLCRKE
ncbi:hypothetical protein SeMB42_g00561 [Synchytrium endobioticum]|uniref:Methyltransferase domain-containing protein n=1 Tax=Synchytrium endobioticum TaxID=286115 RepID=A0A507DGF2_9FUNG|nr:hypothetical protein SeLEV6574_g01157 [Synchytrium endobioticum]TPX53886.1 hypothetical protein SeMB42_g00561 [Synchytrium endobioticum]